MQSGIKIKRSVIIITCIAGCVLLLTKCMQKKNKKITINKPQYSQFAGSASCAGCHKNIYNSHLLTEHHLSSATVTVSNIMGSFEKERNKFFFHNDTYVAMEKRDSGFYQAEYFNDEEEKNGRFDIVIGSGRKGQSYLSWVGNSLVQMPITFFTAAKSWSNSPGFPIDKARYYRPITSRCLECHATFFDKTSKPAAVPEQFNHDRIIYGVDCEKCHGPAAKHVQFQTENPQIKKANFIINPTHLSRQQNLDLCALCHGGRLNKIKPSFQFQPGDKLADYFSVNKNTVEVTSIDVHGNQLGLLSASKCFMLSQLTCTNCHNTHENENNKIALFSQRCQACHSYGHEKTCKMVSSIGPSITQNCIDCHMPRQPSQTIAVNLQGSDTLTPVLMRTHYIKIYPDETKKVLAYLKKFDAQKMTGR